MPTSRNYTHNDHKMRTPESNLLRESSVSTESQLFVAVRYSRKHFPKLVTIEVKERCQAYKNNERPFLVGAFRIKTQTI